jgi:tetratricopeptide (TPR) repeat protein
MNRISAFLFCIWICLVFLSCNTNRKKVNTLFDTVENIVEQYPDSALILLDSIRNPYELNESQHAKYVLLSVQAKDKAYRDITSDTLIFSAKDYFQKEDDQKNLALFEFYCGRVLQSQGEIEKAIETYLKVRDKANEIKDIYLCGLSEFFIGELNYSQRLYDEAISHYKNAENNFSLIGDKYKNQIISCMNIGNSFLLKNFSDSAFFYHHKGLDIAKFHNDSASQINILQNMGVAFLKINEADSAKNATLQALSLASNREIRAKLYLNMAKIHNQENKNDSALFYSNQALSVSNDDNSLKVAVFILLSRIEESNGNYQKSLDYHKQYSKYLAAVYKGKENSNILDIQKKYDFELLQNANKNLIINRLWISIGLILSVVFIAIMLFVVYRNRRLNVEALLTAKQQIYQLKEMVNKEIEEKHNNDKAHYETNKKIKDVLFRQLDVSKKISLMESYFRDDEKGNGIKILKKMNEILYDSNNQFDWDIFYQPINALYNDFIVQLKNLYPELTEEEVLICCLSKVGFNNTEIALLTKSPSENVIRKKKAVIRKKTGMKKQENFTKQLSEIAK